MTADEWESLALRLSSVFQPSAPIDKEKLFRGRRDQVRAVVDAINQVGRHAIIFGGRGVGKTSLGKTLPHRLHAIEPTPVYPPYVTCDSGDDFSSIWEKAFLELRYMADSETGYDSYDEIVDRESWTPFDIRRHIERYTSEGILYFVFDEFDKLECPDARQAMADTIKLFSDHAVDATLLIIGVADDAIGLIDDHRSIVRCLSQIPMPRMNRDEMEEIVTKGLEALGMQIEADALDEVTGLSKGLPTYVHLLALYAGRQAVDSRSKVVKLSHVKSAIEMAILNTEQTIRAEYETATFSARETLYPAVLLACAMTITDEFGRFSPNDVCDPLFQVTGKTMTSDRYSSHLKAFCEDKRGYVLRKVGSEYRWRYQFTNPLLQPYIIMKGLHEKVITEDQLNLRSLDDDHPLFQAKP